MTGLRNRVLKRLDKKARKNQAKIIRYTRSLMQILKKARVQK